MTETQLSTAVIENPEMLKYQRRQQQQQLDQKGSAARETGSATSVAGVVNGESLEDIRKVRAGPSGTEDTGTCPGAAQGQEGKRPSRQCTDMGRELGASRGPLGLIALVCVWQQRGPGHLIKGPAPRRSRGEHPLGELQTSPLAFLGDSRY